ncbi:MAG: MFS transporter, partial [Pseudomonadota bacterium]
MRQLTTFCRQMTTVAIGWQAYDIARQTRSIEEAAFILGLIGLTMFLPVLLFSLIGGQAADRFDKTRILLVASVMKALCFGALASQSFGDQTPTLLFLFVASGALGFINAFVPAASNALYPTLVPRDMLPTAIGWNALGFQSSSIIGPAFGGYLFIGGAELVYSVAGFLTLVSTLLVVRIGRQPPTKHRHSNGLSMVVEGIKYLGTNKLVLGSISLDLIVVFFGGATALLPVFARDILDVGASGLGLLRAAPAVGAVMVATVLATAPLKRRVGKWMFAAVVLYGFAMLGFGISTSFWLSVAILIIAGASDMVSVYVRQSLIQLST